MTTQRARKGPKKLNQLKPSAVSALMSKIPERLAAGENVKQMLSDGGNLYLSILPTGTASWVFRYAFNRANRAMGLGPVHSISLAEAREHAADARRLLSNGIDPMEQKAAIKAEIIKSEPAKATKNSKVQSFFDVLEDFLKDKAPEHKDKTWATTWRNSLTEYVKPIFGETPINEITYDMALSVFHQKLIVDGKKTTFWLGVTSTAARVRQRIIQIMSKAAAVPGYTGESPLMWNARFENDLPKAALIQEKENFPSLPYALIPDFVAALRKRGGVTAHYLEFLILTIGPRSTPTLNATWDQMDMVNKTWTIPRGNLKARKNAVLQNFVVPLSDRCIQILEAMKKVRQDDFVFPSAKKKAPMSRSRVTEMIEDMCLEDEKAGIKRRWVDPDMDNARIVPHGFRATFTSYIQDKMIVETEIREFSLGHKVKGAVAEAYNRGKMLDKRRALMDAWAAAVDGK